MHTSENMVLLGHFSKKSSYYWQESLGGIWDMLYGEFLLEGSSFVDLL